MHQPQPWESDVIVVGLVSRITEKLEKQQKLEQERKKRQKHQVSIFGRPLFSQSVL